MSLLRGVRRAGVFAGISAVVMCGVAVAAQSTRITKGKAAVPFTPALKAGEYLWYPEASPAGPLVIIISVPEQSMHVYRNGVRIGRSSISSGTQGHRTPTGVFTILEKHVKHVSSIYKGAQMPHMQRLTWRGVAMHAGYLPGYPASHGCVRLPAEFAEKLYAVTTIGSTVIVVDHKSAPTYSTRPGLIFGAAPASTLPASTAAGFTWTPEKSPVGPISIVVSAVDHLAFVYRNGLEIGRAAFSGELSLTGAHVYSALASTDAEGRRDWISTASVGGQPPELRGLSGQLGIAPEFISNLRPLIEPGTTLVLTAASVNGQTQSKPGFKILTSEGPRERAK